MKRTLLPIVFTALLVFAGCVRSNDEAPSDTDAPAVATAADPVERGQESYARYCQSCHGEDGKGRGEVSDDLHSIPADLTTLAERNNGTFPVETVYNMIDGREEVEAHGSREMPVWGNIWTEEDGQPVPEEQIQVRINELVEYIRTLQAS